MKKVLAILAGICAAVSVQAQALSSLLIPTDSRSLAMGGTLVRPDAGTLDAGAFFGMWSPSYINSTVAGLDAFIRIGKVSVEVGGVDFLDKPYDISTGQGTLSGAFQPYDLVLSLGASYQITDGLSAGLKLRSITSALAENAVGSTYCGDVTVSYGASAWSVALSGRNIGGKINYGGGDWALPGLVALDGSWTPLSGLLVTAQADYLFSGAFMAAAGAEYTFADIVSVRGGFHYGDPAKALPTFASLGLGVKLFGVKLDAAYILPTGTPANSFAIRLGYSF